MKKDVFMRFAEIPSNHQIKRQLIKATEHGRLSHAHLFVGDEGSASLAISLAFAQYLMCTDKTDSDSCGKCASCLKCDKLIHPDVHFIFPVITNKSAQALSEHFLEDWRNSVAQRPYMFAEDWLLDIGAGNKQGFISAHEANNLAKKLSLKPYENSYRLIIIWQADKMRHAAANKLLKVLEEPPSNTIFVLLASSQEFLLETIVSRLQTVHIDPASENELSSFLVERYNITEQNAKELSTLSAGNIGRASHLCMGSESLEQNTTEFQTLMRLCYQAKILDLSHWVDSVSRWGRENQKGFLNYALHMIRECLIFNFAEESIQRLRPEERAFTEKFAPFIHSQNMSDIIQELEKAHIHISRNGSPKFIFMDLALKLTVLLHAKKVTLHETIRT
ncbi:MAG: DNA polymerase III subunit delta [Bacteroidota bacterium]|nr:DNA polymerase III subunit delta [Bacteroidota bacterium]